MTPPADRSATPLSRRRRNAVLRLLQEAGDRMSTGDIARSLDMHPNTVRFHLDGLLTDGRVGKTTAAPSGAGRPKVLYEAHPGMDPTGVRNYRILAEMLAEELGSLPDAETRAVQTGRAWGARLIAEADDRRPAIGRLTELLEHLGFDPAVEPTRVNLRHCPFLDLIGDHGRLLCPLHLGLMQGALETAAPAATTVTRLEPFVQPDRCVAHLSDTP